MVNGSMYLSRAGTWLSQTSLTPFSTSSSRTLTSPISPLLQSHLNDHHPAAASPAVSHRRHSAASRCIERSECFTNVRRAGADSSGAPELRPRWPQCSSEQRRWEPMTRHTTLAAGSGAGRTRVTLDGALRQPRSRLPCVVDDVFATSDPACLVDSSWQAYWRLLRRCVNEL
jgi:hypothetical protein